MYLSLRGTPLARGTPIALAAMMTCFSTNFAAAGDDGAAPLWVGIGSIFGPLMGFSKEEKAPIDYHDHGKIVLPPKVDLPPPDPPATQTGGEWPVNQEIQHKKIAKEAAKKEIAGVGDARLRYTHPFPPNTPVTVGPSDQQGPVGAGAGDKAASPTMLGNLNPMSWVGMGKSVPLGPEPDREWLTDPPTGYRAPVGPVGEAGN
ncbi:MAG TPA: hypothetical protein VJY34_10915 [Roseiarcus sp.]|nr:hypothetical protein [Roseiarcus sp.]